MSGIGAERVRGEPVAVRGLQGGGSDDANPDGNYVQHRDVEDSGSAFIKNASAELAMESTDEMHALMPAKSLGLTVERLRNTFVVVDLVNREETLQLICRLTANIHWKR